MTRKAKTFYASRGNLTAEGTTKAEAKAKLETMIDWALQYRPLFMECRFGYVFAIAASAHGYDYAMFEPSHGAHGVPTCSWGQDDDMGRVLQSCRIHAAQNAWTFGVDEATHIEASGLNETGKRELTRWIGFQHAYRAAKDKGFTDSEAHEWACRAPYQIAA